MLSVALQGSGSVNVELMSHKYSRVVQDWATKPNHNTNASHQGVSSDAYNMFQPLIVVLLCDIYI